MQPSGSLLHSATPSAELPWVEKYRPKCIGDVVHQEPVKRMLTSVLKRSTMPHCLFYGPPGTGKTSAALALCLQLFGEENFKRRVLELNASDDRGIDVVRDKIKTWTRTLVGGFSMGDSGRRSIPEWKVVILDEADMMTTDAQSALRRIMEDNAKTTRFIIICNYLSRIIDPIASRCAKFRFERISTQSQLERLRHISACEQVRTVSGALEEILALSDGDLRVAVTLLQSASVLASSEALTRELVQAVAATVAKTLILDASKKQSASRLVELEESVIADGWDVNQVVQQVLRCIVHSKALPDMTKSRIVDSIAESQFRLTQGANEALQLLHIVGTIHKECSGLSLPEPIC